MSKSLSTSDLFESEKIDNNFCLTKYRQLGNFEPYTETNFNIKLNTFERPRTVSYYVSVLTLINFFVLLD